MQMQSSLVSYSNNRVIRWVWNNANLIYLISGFFILHLQTDNQLAKVYHHPVLLEDAVGVAYQKWACSYTYAIIDTLTKEVLTCMHEYKLPQLC